jgi:hypothetical protein
MNVTQKLLIGKDLKGSSIGILYWDYSHQLRRAGAISLSPRTVDLSGEILLYCHELTSSSKYLLFET